MLKNPFLVYLLSFGAVLGLYELGWSEIYPSPSYDLLLFFGLTFLSAVILARFIAPAIRQTGYYQPGLLPKFIIWLVIGTFLVELVFAGGIPLFLVLGGDNFFKSEASASHLHVFTFWNVFAVIRFADYMYSHRRRYLIEAALPVIFYGLLVYRGPAIMALTSFAFVFVIRHGGIKFKHGIMGAAAGVLVLFLNGVLGDLRSPGQENAGVPSSAFKKSGIPQTFFWSYLYATAPVANFQLTIDKMNTQQGSVTEFIASELLPDYLAKRLLPLLSNRITTGNDNLQSRDQLYSWEQPQVSYGLNVGTIFGRSYGFFGWVGPVILFVTLSSFVILYLLLIRRSPYRVPCLALLNTLVAFCLFNNMLASGAMLPQMIWPLLLPPWWIKARPTALERPAYRQSAADPAAT